MKLSSTSRPGRGLRALPAEALVALSALLTFSAPAPAPVDRATAAQALVAATATSGSGGVVVEHHLLAELPASGATAVYQGVDAPLPDVATYQILRVRFRIHNTGDGPATVTPRLEYRPTGTGPFAVVPSGPDPGDALHVRREWIPSPTAATGTVPGPPEADLPVDDFLMHDAVTEVRGHRSSQDNPDRPLSLPAGAATEVEFSISISGTAEGLSDYQLRLTDDGATLGADLAAVEIEKDPPLHLSPGQRQGEPEAAPKAAPTSRSGVRFPLTMQTAAFVPTAAAAVADIHGPYSATADQCAVCHRAHTASGPELLTKAAPQSTLCFTCHDGTGATHNVKSEYTGATANVPADRAYYQHDALSVTSHKLASEEEFAGVLNRHSECGDCHNPHQAKDTPDGTMSSTGWTPSGRLAGISGVSVTNGAAGTNPTYSFLNGEGVPLTQEYQLCFKCHSGYTTLPSNSGFTPSRYVLDKGVELNPNNGSYHPVEAAGKNTTTKMAASLAGTSPYKLWNFTTASTIRCTQCHARDARTPAPAAGANLPPHTSVNRGILLAPYRDRVLGTFNRAYTAADFALCLLCHAEAPFANTVNTATNFRYHGLHVMGISDKGAGGTNIDTAGAGQGNAICAECHFRIHSPQTLVGTQDLPGSRLVSFAPNVQGNPTSARPQWRSTGTGTGNCTLTCHGEQHNGYSYTP